MNSMVELLPRESASVWSVTTNHMTKILPSDFLCTANAAVMTGSEVIKPFSCSTQLRLKFVFSESVIVGIFKFISRINEPPHGKTNNLHRRKQRTAKLISAFVFATRIVQFLFYLKPKFQASSSFLCLYRSVCVRPVFPRGGSNDLLW